ncbi:hypothetical protein ACJ73_02986 [Blastomyces percursus]|uniref:Uncharacterized protein n=1 Tax=Blastomyces percursus TaxID=1658174 RepID=A0A1J9QC43_9EURO|nr:hypothetical protein ACJ73_02986 [Blastomyces percursus]
MWGRQRHNQVALPVEALPLGGELGIQGVHGLHRQHTEPTISATTTLPLPLNRAQLNPGQTRDVTVEYYAEQKQAGRDADTNRAAQAGFRVGSANTTVGGSSSVALAEKQQRREPEVMKKAVTVTVIGAEWQHSSVEEQLAAWWRGRG